MIAGCHLFAPFTKNEALRYKRRFADRGLAHWGLADRSLANLRLLVDRRARQICSIPSEVPVATRNFNMSILPITRDKT